WSGDLSLIRVERRKANKNSRLLIALGHTFFQRISMAEHEVKKVEAETAPPPPAPLAVAEPPPTSAPPVATAAEEKSLVPVVDEKAAEKPVESKALALVETKPEAPEKKLSGGSHDRDAALADLEKEKKMSFVRAWEDSEKSKVTNKAEKQLSDVTAWENHKKAAVEAKLKKIEVPYKTKLIMAHVYTSTEQLEKKKAQYAEQMKNRVAEIHKQAEEKRAMAEETAAKYRATGQAPKKMLGCF
ncbi:unnamed protein product, partial [Linum perenne]